ncbi:alcohol dehydrogenase-like protein Bli-4 [Podospora didyma]|uniref:Alcohol dehydrogenase-like protein Bli-4 n=1 Tax=Podospora didyma TaxID=330526 RepID=A0AAE0NSD0_9PEZI|nr:alcohol dehydrogenase-like protein Bli-4 [Podospora didyma]
MAAARIALKGGSCPSSIVPWGITRLTSSLRLAPPSSILPRVRPSQRTLSTSSTSRAVIPGREYVKNTLAENFGGPMSKLGTHQFSLNECPDLSGKVAVVTGGSRGIGYGVAHTLLKHNISKLYIISVSKKVMDTAKETIAKELGQDKADRTVWMQCDLSDWKRVQEVAEAIAKDTDRLDILVNNSGRGIMTASLTDYGVDRHMAVNAIGHIILTSHLLPLMKKTAEQGNIVRISNQASNAHVGAPKDTQFASLEEINEDAGPNGQYGRSKLANILYTRYFDRNVTKNGHPNIFMNATHPGFVSTKQSKEDIHEPYPIAGYAMSFGMDPIKKDKFQGAVPTVYAVTMAEDSGQFICAPATPEAGSEMSQNDKLGDNLMDLTKKLASERCGVSVAV